MDLEERLSALRQQIAQHQAAQAKAEARKDLLRSQLESAMAELVEHYGVDSLADAEALLATMEAELAAGLDEAEQMLRSV